MLHKEEGELVQIAPRKVNRKARGREGAKEARDAPVDWASLCESGTTVKRPNTSSAPSMASVNRNITFGTAVRMKSEHGKLALAKRLEAQGYQAERQKYFDMAHQAYAAGEGALAKEYSEKGKVAGGKLRRLNQEAKDLTFIDKNLGRDNLKEIDLHGISRMEALEVVQKHIELVSSIADGVGIPVCIITGAGIHSEGGKAVIKPAVMEWLTQRGYKPVEGHGQVDVVVKGQG